MGEGARAQIPAILAEHGHRIFVLVDPFIATTPRFAALREAIVARGLDIESASDIPPELPVESLVALTARAREFGPDAILAVGGGSVLDAAKLVALLATHGGALPDYYGENAVPGPVLPIVAVPTTAGTGSEATPVAVVSDPDRALKVGVSSRHLVPAVAVVDAEFTLGAPAGVTAASGIDALVHAAESYTAAPLELDWSAELPVFLGRNLVSDTIALDAAQRIGRWLPVAVEQPEHREARRELAYGSLLGGISFASSGTHLSHALQYPIGALTHTPHGVGTGLMLPYVLDAIRVEPGTAGRIAELGLALGSTADSVEGRVDDAVAITAQLGQRIGLPSSLAALGVEREQLPHIAELGLQSRRLLAISPIPASAELLLEILERAHDGALTGRSI
ncbi:MAG: iron-containing alcohol dehydrogenase [Actinomycetales bacterium]|nr:iron-containing alcohol dehydrogenase [Actinomycetales bacterium]